MNPAAADCLSPPFFESSIVVTIRSKITVAVGALAISGISRVIPIDDCSIVASSTAAILSMPTLSNIH